MKRLKFHDEGYNEWLKAENAAHDEIVAAGYRPQGMNIRMEKMWFLKLKTSIPKTKSGKFTISIHGRKRRKI